MNNFKFVCALVCVCLYSLSYGKCEREEPQCTSRYDFESKLLKSNIKLEFDMAVLKEQYKKDMEALQTNSKDAMENIQSLSELLKREQKSEISRLEAIGLELKQTVEEKMGSLEDLQKTQESDFADLYKNLQAKYEQDMTKIKEKASKPPVVFVSKQVSNSNARDTALIFSNTQTNIGDAYDANSGYFTAPVNGTYIFSVQLCPSGGSHVIVDMFINETALRLSTFYNKYTTCSTANTFASLHIGTSVCVKLVSGSSSGNVLYQDTHYVNMFMGALVH